MVTFAQVEPLRVELAHRYNISMEADIRSSNSWNFISGQALVDYVSLPQSSQFGVYQVVCFRDHYVIVRTPNNPGSSAQISAVALGSVPNMYGTVWQAGLGSTNKIYRANNMGVAVGNPLKMERALFKNATGFDNTINSDIQGTHRYGWKAGKPVLGTWRGGSLTPGHFQIWLSDGSHMDIPSGGVSVLRIQDWFQYPRGVVLPYLDYWVCLTARNGAKLVFFGPQTPISEQDAILGGDPAANAIFQGIAANSAGRRIAAGSSGWIIDCGPNTGIFPGQGKRFFFLSKVTWTWRDIQLIPLDANASARIANAGSENFRITQSEFDGLFYGKADQNTVISDQILVSPEPPKQILPQLVPLRGLPPYGIYDQPYGVQR